MELIEAAVARGRLGRGAATWIIGAVIGVAFMGSLLVTPLYVMYEAKFHFSPIMLTLIYSSYIIGNVVSLLWLGRVSDLIGRRIITLVALGVGAVSALLFLSASSTTWLFIARAVSGLSVGLITGTDTAWLTELDVAHSRARASLIATTGNFVGAAVGPLVSGALAQFMPFPLETPYVVYFAIILVLAMLTTGIEETVYARQSLSAVDWTPRIGLPRPLRGAFIAPAISVFGAMAIVGYYAALVPNILAENLHATSHFLAGIVVSVLCATVAITIVVTRAVQSRQAMLTGLGLMLPSLALMSFAQFSGSLAALIAASLLGGAGTALSYRGSLQVVNEIAPADCRAEVLSLYFVAAFAGNGVPVIGVGIIGTIWSPIVGGQLFAAVIAAFSVIAILLTAVRREKTRD